MNFAEIYGQRDIKEHLQRAISHEKYSHAYIISGENDTGKMMLAEAFAATILCESPEKADACGECVSCKQAMHHNHPDIHYITHEKPNIIGVDDIRRQLNDDIVIKPYASKHKIYIIDEAEKLNVQAQNALLKTIEEPPSYAIIFLLTTNSGIFLPTILSRCVTLEMKPVSQDIIKKYLMEECHIPDYQADVCNAFAQGNFGKAMKLASSVEFNEMKVEIVDLLRRLGQMDVYEISELAKVLDGKKDQIDDYLDFMTIWFRDVLLYKATANQKGLIFVDEALIIKKQAQEASYQGLVSILDAIEKAKKRISIHVNVKMTLELLLLTIKENVV